MIHVGYACINLTLEAGTNGTTRLALIGDRERWLAPCQRNLEALERILEFNAQHGLSFRVGSGMVPFASHQRLEHPWESLLGDPLRRLGQRARELGIRLSMHPGQYCIPGSPRPEVVESSLAELRYSAQLLNLMGADDGVIVVHMGGQYGDFEATRRRTVAHLRGETEVLSLLAFEHDDRVWPAQEVLPACDALGLPLIADNLHHRLLPGTMAWPEVVREALARWGARRPKLHLSSQAEGKRLGAHADLIAAEDLRNAVECLGQGDYDLMVEAKLKEQAALLVQRELTSLGLQVRLRAPVDVGG